VIDCTSTIILYNDDNKKSTPIFKTVRNEYYVIVNVRQLLLEYYLALQRLLGHSTMEMVKIYVKLSEVDLQQAHRRASPVENLRL
jgi:hypothetical protein